MRSVQLLDTASLIASGVLEIGDGYRAKNSEFVADGGLPFVRVKDVGSRVNTDFLDELPATNAARYGPKISQPGDSLITMKGTVGRVAAVDASTRPFVYSPQISYWRSLDPGVLHPQWIRYWLEGPEFRSQADATKGATDMADYINLRDQRNMTMSLPSINTQRGVASILGAIDDLIENNRRRIELLEQMAEAIYREWFVEFRFPGHEGAAFVESPHGRLPDGWGSPVSRDLIDAGLLEIGDGYRAKNSELVGDESDLPFVRVANLQRGTLCLDGCDYLPSAYLRRLKGKVSRPGDSVISMKGTVGRSAFVDDHTRPVVYSPQISYWRSLDFNAIQPTFLHAFIRSDAFRLQCAVVKGSTDMADYVNLADQRSMRLVVPSPDLMAVFESSVGRATRLATRLDDESKALTTLRDLMLPKLVSGEIDVSHLDLDALAEATS